MNKTSHFDSNFFTGNRQRLRKLVTNTNLIVISANGLLQRSGDTTFPFRQDSSFWYLTGLDEPDIVLVMDKDEDYLIMPERSSMQKVFDGSIESESLLKLSGLVEALEPEAGWKRLTGSLKQAPEVAVLKALDSYDERLGIYVNPARQRLIDRLQSRKSGLKLQDIRPQLAGLRMVKQSLEIKAIRRAVAITEDGFERVHARLHTYKYEYQVAARLTSSYLNSGAEHAYQPIVAADKNACTLHYVANSSALGNGSLLLLDSGAEVEHYAADITRTCALGRPTKRQLEVAAAVRGVQQFALSLLKPGVSLKAYEQKIERFMGQTLRELGLIKANQRAQIRKYYPHSTSHFLGLDVHDVGDYKRPLEPGVVLTVEPGIYIPEEGIGIRIEDDVLVTKDGIEVLSHRLPTDL